MILKVALISELELSFSLFLSLSFSLFPHLLMANGSNILQCIKVEMVFMKTTLCNVNDYVPKHDRHAKNKVICALLWILRGN
jgi:hypothetical protein